MSNPNEPPPITTTQPLSWRTRIDPRPRLRRVRESVPAIIQIVIAAVAAYAFARNVLGHPAPLLAPTVAITSLGIVRDARPVRVLETVVAMLFGILVAEGILLLAGPGWWQLSIALAITLVLARLLSAQAGFAIPAAIQAVIVMATVTTTVPWARIFDGVVGGVAALLATALIPRSPQRAEVEAGHALFARVSATMTLLAYAMDHADVVRGARSLERARKLQTLVDDWGVSLESGLAITRISPFLRRQRQELQRHQRIQKQMDLAARNLRVIARSAVYRIDDGVPRPEMAAVIRDLIRGIDLLDQSLDDISVEPVARETFVSVARRLDPGKIVPGAGIGEQHMIASVRPLAVDLLIATGMPPDDARATMPRV